MSIMTLVEFLLARIAEDEAAAKNALTVWPSPRWRAESCTAYGWRNGRLGPEPTLPFVVSDDEHGSLLLASIWPEDGSSLTGHVARHDPARVLAECEAKRRLVERASRSVVTRTSKRDSPFGNLSYSEGHYFAEDGRCVTDEFAAWHLVDGEPQDPATLRLLALPYSTHPDYREEWRPTA